MNAFENSGFAARFHRRRIWFSTLILAALLTGGYALLRPLTQSEEAARYRTLKIDRGDIRQAISANGTLNPVVLVNVGTQVSGTIGTLHADFNDRVEKGQILAELDPSLFKAQLEQSLGNLANAKAALKLAQLNERRAHELFARDYIPRAEWDQAIQALESAQAQVLAAQGQVRRDRTNLDYSVIRSPVSGVVISRNVDVGQTVAASFQTPTLFTIAQDLKRMQIDTTVAEADIGGVKAGQTIRFTVDAFPDREFQGKVRQVRMNSQVQQNVVTYNVVIDVDNPEEMLMPGMTAFVSLVVAERHATLRVPMPALRYRPEGREASAPKPEGKVVYRLEHGTPVRVEVRVGITDGKFAELLSDNLSEGDDLVVEDLKDSKKGAGKAQAPGGFRVRAF